ncbi:hypothetical protein GCK72_001661 [Caenorhabditis remanei]|uniref:Katanin p80 subunit C-terminal domain-containing protein n=1 Tax=Caenorhabditis remanei TaxID=31234 RepID=A0A6A5HT92_CAERE|nr:hypothetical protein GCK72_001661 [Caenorhabditis remanei]KAF1769844.1 hypothetical protein GCK72_001661 [Caenorhabditis remanei]
MALASVSVYELSRLSSNYAQQSSTAVRRRSNSTKVRRKGDESLDRRRRSHNQNQEPITITYLGRPRSPSVDHVPTSPPIPMTLRNRRPSPATLSTIKKVPSTSSITATPSSPTKKMLTGSSGPKKPKAVTSPTPCTSDVWNDCIEVVNEIGILARREIKNMRRLRIATSRRIKIGEDEETVLTATRILSRSNAWTLDTCHEYLGVLVDNIISIDERNRSIALEGLAAISDNLTDRLLKFANISAHRIGVDVAAEERAEKAKTCILLLRSVVKKRDWYYRQLDEESIDKLDATMERLKKI